jgi:hypothetical protein
MQKSLLKELNQFLGKAMLNTYAGGGAEIEPKEPGFNDLDFKEGDWSYKDSYTGFFQSWGREAVWYKNKPLWAQVYGGGMTEKYQADLKFALETFNFLKKSLSAGEKQSDFQPRGPKEFVDGDWRYACEVTGDIAKFEGHEKIFFKDELVFTHDFLGGVVIAEE